MRRSWCSAPAAVSACHQPARQLLGATVTGGGASSPEKLAAAEAEGATRLVDHTAGDLRQALREQPPMAPTWWSTRSAATWVEPALRSLHYGGRFVTVGSASGTILRCRSTWCCSRAARSAFEFLSFMVNQPDDAARNEAELLDLLASGRVRPTSAPAFDRAADALALVGSGGGAGQGRRRRGPGAEGRPLTVRWGSVGARGHRPRVRRGDDLVDDGRITAVASSAQERADAFAAEFRSTAPTATSGPSPTTLPWDAVYVATVAAATRPRPCSLEAGKAVLCEKPFAPNATQARALADAAATNGVFCMEALWSRFLRPTWRSATCFRGRIGEVLQVDAEFALRWLLRPAPPPLSTSPPAAAAPDLGIYPVQLSAPRPRTREAVVAAGRVGTTGVDEQVAAVLRRRATASAW